MSTPISEPLNVLNTLKSSEEVFANDSIPLSYVKLALMQLNVFLETNYKITKVNVIQEDSSVVQEDGIVEDLDQKYIYLWGLYTFRNYAHDQHSTLTRKAVNFKTISFAVTGLTERAKEAMRIVWWCDNEIKKTEETVSGLVVGHATTMTER